MDKYEISLWEDYPDTINGNPVLNERKLCIIGTDTMKSQNVAYEPKMVSNINGTNTFTFKMKQLCLDEITGEMYLNPFSELLINERKVKVKWKDKWYDMLIKTMEEDSVNKCVTYTCQDLYITELSRNGYNLEFSSELQNNSGTASELVEKVLDGSGWQFDKDGSTKIYQYTEEPVYEVTTSANTTFTATKQNPPAADKSETIPKSAKILVFYSSVVDVTESTATTHQLQFLYSASGYATDGNDMLVINGNCYSVEVSAYESNGSVDFKIGNTSIVTVDTTQNVSTRYRANRLVKTEKTVYDKLLDRYVTSYNNGSIYGYTKTEFTDPLMVVNLVANPNSFTSTDGWTGSNLNWGIYPKFTSTSSVTTYGTSSNPVHSYLKVSGTVYNSGISSNQQYLKPTTEDIKNGNTGGFHKGEKYILRLKYKNNASGNVPGSYQYNSTIIPHIYKRNDTSATGSDYFNHDNGTTNGSWWQYILTCKTSCPASEIDTLGLFLTVSGGGTYWIEDIEFFKYVQGAGGAMIEPGNVGVQSIARTVYRYYNANHKNTDGVVVTDPLALTYLYEGYDKKTEYVADTNNYEKITTIEAKESNRFNILQSIAETFECWVRFEIDHDTTGKITFDTQGNPNKRVRLVEYIGTDLGWSFEYGVDVKSIKRKIVSDTLTTKVIVLPNDNEFAQNGFCTIARSNMNYAKENFVLDFGYFINQKLLDKDELYTDLYSFASDAIGYYYKLHKWNKQYDDTIDKLAQKKTELVKQNAELTVLQGKQTALEEQITQCEADIATLACVSSYSAAESYAQTHTDNTKLQSLINTRAQLKVDLSKVNSNISSYTTSIGQLKSAISNYTTTQNELIADIEEIHEKFYKKYARFIQEGTWQDSGYVDDDKYYLDAVDVAYTSSRPQLQYEINVMRLASLDDFSSKVFDVGDICYVVDREFFGYAADGITPYKLKIIISEITSYFDEPSKDTIKVQNYKTQFDDLFQRITATTQSLQYASGKYERAAGLVNEDRTIDFTYLQETFDQNKDLVLSASNQKVTWDATGITVIDENNAGNKLKLMSGGLFITNDGGATWKNAVRGDGISTDVLTAGKINTGEIFIYNGSYPSFRWDSYGIDAYYHASGSNPDFGKFVRFDRFGLYGYRGSGDFVPANEDAIWGSSNVKFGVTWKGFFLKGSGTGAGFTLQEDNGKVTLSISGGSSDSGASFNLSADKDSASFSMNGKGGTNSLTIESNSSSTTFSMISQTTAGQKNYLEISTANNIVIGTTTNNSTIERVKIGRSGTDYGIWIKDTDGNNIFSASRDTTNQIGGWVLTKDSFFHSSGGTTIGLYSQGKTGVTIQGVSNKSFYILAGSNFGVTINGEVYASLGKIGGWTIGTDSLSSSKAFSKDGVNYVGKITIDSSGNIKCVVTNSSTQVSTTKWQLNNDGSATFKDINAESGTIAGWHIGTDKIYNDAGTTLGSANSYYTDSYTIVTNSISASEGSIGGCTVDSNGISGSNWNLNSTGGRIGGWNIGESSIYSDDNNITLDASTAALSFYGGGNVQDGDDGYVLINNLLTSTIKYSEETSLIEEDVTYLHWLNENWGEVTPDEVRVEGADGVYVDQVSLTSEYLANTNYSYTITPKVRLKNDTTGRDDITTMSGITMSFSEAYNNGVAEGESHFTYVGEGEGSYNKNS